MECVLYEVKKVLKRIKLIDAKQDLILSVLANLEALMANVTPEMQKLLDDVAAEQTTVDSVKVAIDGLVEKLRTAAGDKEATIALAAQIEGMTTELHTAVAAGTTADPQDPTAAAA